MKKIIIAAALVMSIVGAANAQASKKAIGLRFNYAGAEATYQHPLGNANRLELDLGLNSYGLGLNGIYQWVWDLSGVAPGVNWYAGAGAALGIYSKSFGIGILGQIGMEYNFEIPLQLSLDYRPGIYVIPSFGASYDGVCLSARYKF